MCSHFKLPILSIFIALSGCGIKTRNNTSAQTSDSGTIKPLIISMSGFATCKASDRHEGEVGPLGSKMMPNIIDLSEFIEQRSGVEPTIMASCFTSERQLVTTSSAESWTLETPSDEDYISKLHNKMEEFTDVYVIGHSYGGWLSMKMIELWQGSPTLIKYLYTIDPISKRLCFFDNPKDCVSAPKDIGAEARQHIKDNTELWVNPWQQKTIFLHSSAIPQADENPRFDISHWEIDNVSDIWNGLKSRLTF